MAPVFDKPEDSTVKSAAAEWMSGTSPVMMRLSDRGASGAARPPVGQHHPGAEEHNELQHCTRVTPECVYFMHALTFTCVPQRSSSKVLNAHAHWC